MKVETHNHPTAISPVSRVRRPVSGGEIRDEGATGRGAQTQGRAVRFLGIQPAHPRCAAALGAAISASPTASSRRSTSCSKDRSAPPRSTTNSAARICAAISAPSRSRCRGRRRRAARLSQADHAGRRSGQHPRRCMSRRSTFPAGATLVVLGGPAMLIGLGGGAASSMASGRSEPKISILPRCSAATRKWSAAARKSSIAAGSCGDDNPILFDPRRRRRRPVERAAGTGSRRRARRALRAARGAE